MKDYTQANLEALCSRQPAFRAKSLETYPNATEMQILTTPSGYPTARIRGAYLHSRYDPVKEARRIIDSGSGQPPSAAVVLGLGLGYLAEAFHRASPEKALLVVEPDPALFVQALGARDLRELLQSPTVQWSIGEQAEAAAMKAERLPLGNLRILRLAALRENEYFQRLEVLLSSIFDKRNVNINTLQRFGQLWIRNLLSNLHQFISNPGIGAGCGLFSGIPALILAAGPSLDEVLPYLEALQQRMLIVAVDTSYRFCKNQGVEADFLVTVDPQYWNSRHLDWLATDRTVLVSESSAHPRVFRGKGANDSVYFVSSFFPLGTYIEETLGPRGVIGAGGSVAATAWDLCRYLGCSGQYMAGLDLGFPGQRTHARGAYFEESMHIRSSRLHPTEDMSFAYLHQARPTALRNNRGGLTLSDRRMLIYKSWFEDQIQQQLGRKGSPSYTLAAEGIAIAGMDFVRPERLLDLAPVRARIEEALTAMHLGGVRMAKAQRPNQALRLLRDLAGELKQLEDLAKTGAKLSAAGAPLNETITQLAEIDRRIMSLASRQIAGFLFQPLIHSIVNNPVEPQDSIQILETSKKLYGQLKDSASYHGKLLQQCLLRMHA